jgi:cytosine/adenosine deaminase-related metal-dependent hydrolase
MNNNSRRSVLRTGGGSISRRSLLKSVAALAPASPLFVAPQGKPDSRSQNPDDGGVLDLETRHTANGNRGLLLKGGTIISMDPRAGDFAKGDVLIRGKTITAVAAEVKAPTGTQVIDASNTILVPGFVDCHRHAWEGQLRRIIPNATTLGEYMGATHQLFALHYRPHDMYVGNLITALGCIDAGITCIVDNSNNARSSEHSNAAIQALLDSGIRALHASGRPQAGEWNHQWPQDLTRLKSTYFAADDQLVRLGMFSIGLNRPDWAVARQLGIRICSEFDGGFATQMDEFSKANLLAADNNYNHAFGLSDTTWQQILGSGGTVDVCPRSDAQYALGEGTSGLQKALDHGARPGFSIDNEVSYGTDMFTEMHVAFSMQRSLAAQRKVRGDSMAPTPIKVRTILECATVNGAACAGLAGKCGVITPGAEADVVMIRTDDINLYPSNNAIGTIVLAADIRNIDTVIIGGHVRKFRGNLVGVNMVKLRRLVDESRGYLFAKAGYELDIFASHNGISG